MKKLLQFTFTLLLFPLGLYAQNITLAYENATITNDGTDDFYEVDVFISSDTDFTLGEGQFLWDYNTAAFGENIWSNGNLEYLRPTNSILGSQTFNVDNYTGFVANDQVADRTGFAWTQFWSGGTIGDNVSETPVLLLKIKIKYANLAEDPGVCFNTVSPRDDQFKTACGPFTPVPAGADCNNEDGTFILDYMPECEGALLPVEVCTGGVRTWDTATGWDGTPPDNTMTAIINGIYNTENDGNLDVCELTITNNGSLTVSPLGFALVQNDVINDGTLVVEHTGNLVQVNDDAIVTNTGNINVNVTTALVDTRDFVMLGSPMNIETREDVWADAYNVQEYNPELFVPFTPQEMGVVYNFQSTSLDVWDPKSGILAPGEGYLVFPQESVTGAGGQFNYSYEEGTLNNGVIARTLQYNGTTEGSPNMLSNPYASAIDADTFFMQNPTINTVYFWEHGAPPSADIPGPNTVNFSMRDVSAFNGTGGIMAASGAGTMPNGTIATAQGFGVFAQSAVDVVFNNAMRLTSGNTTLRSAENQKDRLWLRIEDLTYGEGANTLIGFISSATDGFDAKYDSPVIDNVVSLYSYIEEDFETGYSIQGKTAFTEDATVHLGFNTLIDETISYQISLASFDGSAWEENTIYLTDKLTGEITNLSESNYTFNAVAGHYEDRFLLGFKRVILDTNTFNVEHIVLSPNPASNNLQIASLQHTVKGVTIVDMKGRVILTAHNLENSEVIGMDVSTLQSGVYFANILTEQGSVNKKFIKK